MQSLSSENVIFEMLQNTRYTACEFCFMQDMKHKWHHHKPEMSRDMGISGICNAGICITVIILCMQWLSHLARDMLCANLLSLVRCCAVSNYLIVQMKYFSFWFTPDHHRYELNIVSDILKIWWFKKLLWAVSYSGHRMVKTNCIPLIFLSAVCFLTVHNVLK